MKAYEFASVIETRSQVEKEFAFFRKMLATQEEQSDNHTSDKNGNMKAYEFASVIEVRSQVEKEFASFRTMLATSS
jgi:hypothetical protein